MKDKTKEKARRRRAGARGFGSVSGQALIEYLLMTLMLLALFTGLYKGLQEQLAKYFLQAGKVILSAYY